MNQIVAAHELQVTGVAAKGNLSSDGHFVVIIGGEQKIVWSPRDGQHFPLANTPEGYPSKVVVHKDSEKITFLAEEGSKIRIDVFHFATGMVVSSTLWHPSNGTPHLLDQNKMLVALPPENPNDPFRKVLQVWDTKSRTPLVEFTEKTTHYISAVHLSPGGRYLYIYFNPEKSPARIVDTKDGKTLFRIPGAREAHSFSADGSKVAVALENGEVEIRSLATGRVVTVLPNNSIPKVLDLAFSPTLPDRLFVNQGQRITLWDTKTDSIAQGNITIDGTTALKMAISPDGKRLVTSLGSSNLILWDTATLVPIAELKGGEGLVYAMKFSTDAATLLTTDTEGVLRMFDLDPRFSAIPSHSAWATSDWKSHVRNLTKPNEPPRVRLNHLAF